MIPVLYDGWTLIHEPSSPAALHTLALLSLPPEGIEPWAALPGEPPDWLPEGCRTVVKFTGSSLRERLEWEQRSLLKLARRAGAKLLHITEVNAPLLSHIPAACSPAVFGAGQGQNLRVRPGKGMAVRLRAALGKGGAARAGRIFWPADLPEPVPGAFPGSVLKLPPLVHPDFMPAGRQSKHPDLSNLELPEAYVLYHGPVSQQALRRVIEAWRWAAETIGRDYPMVLIGIKEEEQAFLKAWSAERQLSGTIHVLPDIHTNELALIYRGCAAFFHPAELSIWGDPIRHALSLGKPVVASETAWSSALAGQSAYLLPQEDLRLLGAALITVLVETDLTEQLSQAAHRRAESWSSAAFKEALGEEYLRLTGG